MKKSALILLVLGINICYAQKADSINIHTTHTLSKEKFNFSEGVYKVSVSKKRIKSLIPPAVLIGYGFIALENDGLQTLDNSTEIEIKEHHPIPVTKLDNYLQYAPVLAVYGLNAIGIKGRSNFRDRTMIYGLSTVIASAIVLPIKHITKIQRPDGSAFNSFPSGHTTLAFAAAEFMRQEYKGVSPWYGVLGYGAASATGILRLYNNRHWVSDVVAGAGFGILSTNLAYRIYPAIKRKFFKNKPMNSMAMPFYQNRTGGISWVYNFRN